MRSYDFIVEQRKGKVPDTYNNASPGAYGAVGIDKYYQLYRASMLMGKSPDSIKELDTSSWIANQPFVGTYTKAEEQKTKAAFKALGVKPKAHITPPSQETPDTNIASPVKGFKGYPR